MTKTAQFLRHNGEFKAGSHVVPALVSKTGLFDVIRETPAFWFVESNELRTREDGSSYYRTLQVSKKTLKLAGRDAPRGGKFEIVEF